MGHKKQPDRARKFLLLLQFPENRISLLCVLPNNLKGYVLELFAKSTRGIHDPLLCSVKKLPDRPHESIQRIVTNKMLTVKRRRRDDSAAAQNCSLSLEPAGRL